MKNIATIQSRFDEYENLKNIKTLEENIVLKNEAIARQRLLNIVLGSAAILLVIIGILIYRSYALRNNQTNNWKKFRRICKEYFRSSTCLLKIYEKR